MLQICLNRKPKSRLLPQDILDCFFYGGVIQMVKYLDDNQEYFSSSLKLVVTISLN